VNVGQEGVNMKTALITGFPGQDACYLAEYLLNSGYKVIGGIKRYSCPNYTNLDYLKLRDFENFHLEILDITDIGSIFDVLLHWGPEEVYNLAAQSFVGNSWRLAFATTQVDALGPLNLLEAIKRVDTKIKFYQASTSEMFGNSSINGFQTEDTPFMPVSPYGVSKLYSFHITKNFRESFGIFACSGILFNHESPIRGIDFVTRKVTDGVARIISGKDKSPIKLGNLDSQRDWGHAKDFVRAQHLILQSETPQDIIIATGQKHSVRQLLEIAFSHVGISDFEKYVQVDDAFIRPNELHSLHASCEKSKRELNWEPEISFHNMIAEMVDADIYRYSI